MLQKLRRLTPLIALQAEQYGCLVGEVLIERANADAGLFRNARRREPMRAFLRQNLNGRIQDSRHKRCGSRLLRLLSRGNLRFSTGAHLCGSNANSECEQLVVFLPATQGWFQETGKYDEFIDDSAARTAFEKARHRRL